MPRARKGAARRRAKNRVLKLAKGYRGGRSKLYRTAKEAVLRAQVYAYRDRRTRKRDFRRLWILRINAACRARGLAYSRFIQGLHCAQVALDRKMLAELAVHDEPGFDELVKLAKEQLVSAAPEPETVTVEVS